MKVIKKNKIVPQRCHNCNSWLDVDYKDLFGYSKHSEKELFVCPLCRHKQRVCFEEVIYD